MPGATTRESVTVVGGGIIAKATALRLADDGREVTIVYERGRTHGQASIAAGAMLGVFSETTTIDEPPAVTASVAERLAARELYDEWLYRIGASAESVGLRPGLFVIANGFGNDDLRELSSIEGAARQFGAPFEHVAPEDIEGLEVPGGRLPSKALFLPSEATLDSSKLMHELEAALLANSRVEVVDARAVGCLPEEGSIAIETSAGPTIRSSQAVLACGAEIAGLLEAAHLRESGVPRVFSGRGVSAVVESNIRLAAGIRTPNRGFACGLHVLPRGKGRLYLGATNRLTTTPDYEAGPSLDELITVIAGCTRQINRRLGDSQLRATSIGHRPVTIDKLPLVGRTAIDNLLVATATYRNGMLLAPRVAQLIAEEIEAPGVHQSHAFSPTREIKPPQDWGELLLRAGFSLVGATGDGTADPAANELLAKFVANALKYFIHPDQIDSKLRRKIEILMARAPMEENLPALYELIARHG